MHWCVKYVAGIVENKPVGCFVWISLLFFESVIPALATGHYETPLFHVGEVSDVAVRMERIEENRDLLPFDGLDVRIAEGKSIVDA